MSEKTDGDGFLDPRVLASLNILSPNKSIINTMFYSMNQEQHDIFMYLVPSHPCPFQFELVS